MPSLDNLILAAVTIRPDRVAGALPLFIVADEQEAQALAGSLAHILDGMAHDLRDGTIIIVRH